MKKPKPRVRLDRALADKPEGKGNPHDFTGTLEDWELRVFQNASNFTTVRYMPRGQSDRRDFKTDFPACLADAREGGPRGVLVYAATDVGRSFALEKQHWDKFEALWRENNKSKPA